MILLFMAQIGSDITGMVLHDVIESALDRPLVSFEGMCLTSLMCTACHSKIKSTVIAAGASDIGSDAPYKAKC